jgi:hypothetical protein
MKALSCLPSMRRFSNARILQSTLRYGASSFRSSVLSQVRHTVTEAQSKSVFYRVSGFERGITREKVWNIIKQQSINGEDPTQPEITVLPTCDSTRTDSSIAIVKYAKHQQPEFLQDIIDKPLGEKVILTTSDNGIRRHIVFDQHFHGFTQLYATPDGRPVRAE